jgi:hypothetical protein
MNAEQQRACREAFDKAGYWPNEVLWKAWQQAWEAALAKTPISENDLRWRFLEHGCQWVSFTPLGGQTRAFDPRDVSAHGLLGLRKYVRRRVSQAAHCVARRRRRTEGQPRAG